jgi:hypothetical protein
MYLSPDPFFGPSVIAYNLVPYDPDIQADM